MFAIAFLGTVALIIFAIAIFAPVRRADEVVFAVPQGAGARDIGEALKTQGLVRSKWAFVTYAALAGRADELKPGDYEFRGRASIRSIINRLVAGPENERAITIPEGWDLFDIALYFERAGIASSEEFWRLAGTPDGTKPQAPELPLPAPGALSDKPEGASFEGYLFPDTYRIYKNAGAGEVLSLMLRNFNAKFGPDLLAEARRQGKTPRQIVIMASLVEKEVRGKRDRRIVAGILWKRLQAGMPLQVDAAVAYPHNLRRTPGAAELGAISPYNTYLRAGLPAGPIGNPGMEAILAALHPEASPYWYYFSGPDGKTVFSTTFEKHKAARGLR